MMHGAYSVKKKGQFRDTKCFGCQEWYATYTYINLYLFW
jgi:hypothetical protein